jgi:hypothetical protein
MNIFSKFKATLRLRKAIQLADAAHARDGHRYYVMPSFNSGGKLLVMDRKNFRQLKLKHYISTKAHVSDLVSESFYFTPYADGNQYLAEADRKKKANQYFAWLEAERKYKKLKRSKKNV